MKDTVLWYIGAAGFFIAAIVSAIGSQWVLAGAFVAVSAALSVLGIRAGRRGGRQP